VTHVQETGTRNWYKSTFATRNLHVCHVFVQVFWTCVTWISLSFIIHR